jgi:lysophospholipase L1-like esterase
MLSAAACLLSAGRYSVADDATPNTPAKPRPNTATQPVPGGVRWYMRNHASNLEKTKSHKFDICFLGDSITAMWPGDLLQKSCGKTSYTNFGIGGDRTENVLWRLDRGELDKTSPKVVVLLIGTNNMGFNQPAEIAEGVAAVISRLQAKCPTSKILLVSIFQKKDAPAEKIEATNTLLAKLDDGDRIRYRDFGALFLDEQGKIKPGMLSDSVHLTRQAYEIWGKAMSPVLAEMCQ